MACEQPLRPTLWDFSRWKSGDRGSVDGASVQRQVGAEPVLRKVELDIVRYVQRRFDHRLRERGGLG